MLRKGGGDIDSTYNTYDGIASQKRKRKKISPILEGNALNKKRKGNFFFYFFFFQKRS